MSLYSFRPSATHHYLSSLRHANALRIPTNPTVGFDIEWKPTFSRGQPENPVALVQIATMNAVYLFHISAMRGFPDSLAQLLADPTIVKTGVGIQSDVRKIHKDYRISPIRNCVDLALLARTMDNDTWKGPYSQSIGLSRLLETYTGAALAKGKITTSNWEARPLSNDQIEYACNDAHAALILYNHLTASPTPPGYTSPPATSYYTFDCFAGQFFHQKDDPPPHPWDTGPPLPAEYTREPWYPVNPHYDPGPPPERQPPANTLENSSTEPTSAVTTPSQDPARSILVPRREYSTSAKDLATQGDRTQSTRNKGSPTPKPLNGEDGQSLSMGQSPADEQDAESRPPRKRRWRRQDVDTWRPRVQNQDSYKAQQKSGNEQI